MTDGAAEYNDLDDRSPLFCDLAKTSVTRTAWGLAQELEPRGCTAVALPPAGCGAR